MPLTPEQPDVLEAVRPLFDRRRSPDNAEQRQLVLAWDAIELVHSDGFESLLEQGNSLDAYASAMEAVGIPAAAAVIAEVHALIPGTPDDDGEAFWSTVEANFDQLKRLAGAFWDACPDGDAKLWKYVTDHPAAFADHVAGNSAGA